MSTWNSPVTGWDSPCVTWDSDAKIRHRDEISPVILSRIPNFVREDYPNFVKFIKDYLEWMERDRVVEEVDGEEVLRSHPNFLYVINDWKYNNEASNNVDVYIDKILADVGWTYKNELTIKKSTLLSCLRDFYLSRGSTQSFEFLFRILFNTDLKIRYPRERMLWLSQANYGAKTFVYIRATDAPVIDSILSNIASEGGYIEGSATKIRAFIEGIVRKSYGQGQYLQVEIQKPNSNFSLTEDATITVADDEYTSQFIPVIDFAVVEAGKRYSEGDEVVVAGDVIKGRTIVESITSGGISELNLRSPFFIEPGLSVKAHRSQYGSGFFGVTGSSHFVSTNSPLKFQFQSGESVLTSLSPPSTPNCIEFSFSSGEAASVDEGYYLTRVEVLSPGKNYRTVPDFIIIPDTETVTTFDYIQSTNIGGIKKTKTISPYLLLSGEAEASVLSAGVDAEIDVVKQLYFVEEGWVDQIGFLGERTTLVDSLKYQQFSYELVSRNNPAQYTSIVDDLLHPVGFNRFDVLELESTNNSTIQGLTSFVDVALASFDDVDINTAEKLDVDIRFSQNFLGIQMVVGDRAVSSITPRNPITYLVPSPFNRGVNIEAVLEQTV